METVILYDEGIPGQLGTWCISDGDEAAAAEGNSHFSHLLRKVSDSELMDYSGF